MGCVRRCSEVLVKVLVSKLRLGKLSLSIFKWL